MVFENLLAIDMDLHSFSWSCSSVAPKPLCWTSVSTLVIEQASVSVFIFSKAMVRSFNQLKFDFMLNRSLNGLPRDARFRTN